MSGQKLFSLEKLKYTMIQSDGDKNYRAVRRYEISLVYFMRRIEEQNEHYSQTKYKFQQHAYAIFFYIHK